MALTPDILIADATLLAMPYASEATTYPGVLLRELTQLEKEVVDLFALAAPERLSAQASDIPIVVSSNPTGYALTPAKVYTDFEYKDRYGSVWPVYLVEETNFDNAPVSPSGIVRGVTFYPTDPRQQRWLDLSHFGRDFWVGDGDSLSYRYIPEPSRVTSITQTLVSPDEAQPYLQWSLTLTILLQSGAPQVALERVSSLRQLARQNLELMAHKRAGT